MASSVAEELLDAADGRVKLTIDGEEYTGYLDREDYAPYLHDDQWPEEGELMVVFEPDAEDVEKHGLPTGVIGIMATEEGPGEWTEPSADVWDPEVDGSGTVVADEYRPLGTLEKVERIDEEENDG